MNKLRRSSRLVKSTAVKDPDLFLRHSEKYKLSLEINSQTQLTVALKRQSGVRCVHINSGAMTRIGSPRVRRSQPRGLKELKKKVSGPF